MRNDPTIDELKARQKETWGGFVVMESFTAVAAPRLVRFAGITPGTRVLDVACGTGVVALTAARVGASVTGLDLTPALLARAQENAEIARHVDRVTWVEGDVESLPFEDASFDVVTSQFGHIFAPRPEVAIREMLRVLKPGGRVAFSTWPPEVFVGRVFSLVARHAPTPPPFGGSGGPTAWGDVATVRERLVAAGVDASTIEHDRSAIGYGVVSPQHYARFLENRVGPTQAAIRALEATQPERLAHFRDELDAICATYFEDNSIRQDFLMTRATKS